MPKISVIVPVYNSEKYLRRCIESILNQTFDDIEVILIDDGSTDDSRKICDEYAAKNTKILVYHQENSGQAAARNFGFKNARAEWICFVDSDDMIHPQMLEMLYEAVIEEKCKIAMCGVCESIEVPEDFLNYKVENNSETEIMDEDGLLHLRENGEHRFWTVWAKLVHREIIAVKPFTNGRIYEDNAIVPQWLDLSKNVTNIKDRLYFYQINCEGTTKKGFNRKQLDYLWALECLIAFFEKNKFNELLEVTLQQYIAAMSQMNVKCQKNKFEEDCIVLKNKYSNTIKKYRNRIILDEKTKENVLISFYPRRYKMLLLRRAVKRTMQEEGILALSKKIVSYIKRGTK